MSFVKMIPIFQGSANEDVRLLLNHTSQLQIECSKLQQSAAAGEGVDLDYYIQKVRSCAYDIAKSTKALVTRFIHSGRGFDDKSPPK